MILLDEKVVVNLIMILLYIILILYLINVFIYCFYVLKKKKNFFVDIFERMMYRYFYLFLF